MENNKKELLEIKKGQTGRGLLIENDGYMTLADESNKLIRESFDPDNWNVPNPFIVNAVFQKADIKNANGRIYPKNILEREIENYQTRIRERRGLGECYTPDAMVLAKTGWLSIVDVKEDDLVFTLNTETNEVELQKVTYKTELDYKGKLINIKGNEINDIVTPNHGYPIYNEKNDFKGFMTAEDICNNLQDLKNCYVPKNTLWKNEKVKDIDDYINQYFSSQENIELNVNNININKIKYDGKVYCIETPNHTWFVRQNGHYHWTKNCNHPDSSTIDLGRVSHNIIELHWEGNTVVGKLAFNLTRGFVKYGICSSLGDTVANLLLNGYKIGVSSRAVGSVEQRNGVLMVGDDLEIICWDVVADPSTPGAWIGSSHEELQPYVESKEYKKNKLLEKVEKIENILL